MQRIFKGGAVLALIAIIAAPALYADDPPPGTQPPSVRIAPPIGLTSESPSVRIMPPIGVSSDPPSVRISPPIGVTSDPPSVRIKLPIGDPSQEESPTLFELFRAWLQARIGPPTG